MALTYAELLREVRDDWLAAVESKQEAEERAVNNYRLFRRFRSDVDRNGGGVDGIERVLQGPFGWSKLTVPIIFWIVETIVPRVAVAPPTLIVKPKTAAAFPYAQAKEIELQDTLEAMQVRPEMHRALKQMVLYGDGPTKVTWDAQNGRPRFTALSWFDWFLSPEASRPDDAEVIWHRTWYTKRQLQRLSRVTDRDGKPMWHGLEDVTGTETIEVGDRTFADRLEASGQGPRRWAADGGVYCLVEGWYQDGTVVVLGGAAGDRLCQVRTSPYLDENGNPIRPFVVFANSVDPESPFSIGDAEMLEDHQVELSTLRNQAIDQTTVNINAPIVYSGSVTPEEVDAAFGQPGGKLRVNGDVTRQVMRMSPGAVSSDFFNFYGNVREESQFISGVNDNQAGQAAEREQTATEIKVINTEANKRWQMKIIGVEDRFGQVGRRIDLLERRYGAPGRAVVITQQGLQVRPSQEGLMQMGGLPVEPGSRLQGALRLSPYINGPGTAYDVRVKAGSLAMPSEREEFQKVMTAVQALASTDPMAAQVDWREAAKMVCEAAGFPVEKLLLSDDEIAQQQMVAALEQQLAMQPAAEPSQGAPAPAPA